VDVVWRLGDELELESPRIVAMADSAARRSRGRVSTRGDLRRGL
jgi:hypothetical protein